MPPACCRLLSLLPTRDASTTVTGGASKPYGTAKRDKRDKRKRLKPAGHSATIEALIQPAIVVGSTLMSAIAAYVLALDEITRLLNRQGQPSDVFIVILCAGMGFLIDMAIIVSATRYKMHAIRDDPREERWLQLARWVLIIGLSSEAMTLFYFFIHLSASEFPGFLVAAADWIHSVLAISRAFLPPVVIAYFAAGVLPVMFDRADRNREIKSRTSSNIMLLIDRLSEVLDTDDKAEQIRALGGQLMLDTYATYDETARTTEDQQLRRDAKLLTHLARIHRLDWSAIAADVAPEMAELAAPAPAAKRQEEPAPAQAPTIAPASAPAEQPAPAQAPIQLPRREAPATPDRQPQPQRQPQRQPAPALTPAAARRLPPANARRGLGRTNLPSLPAAAGAEQEAEPDEPAPSAPDRIELRRKREEAARAIVAEDPGIIAKELARRIAITTRNRISESTARAIRDLILNEQPAEAEQPERPALRIIDAYASDAEDAEERQRN